MNLDPSALMELGIGINNGGNVVANPNSPLELKPDVSNLLMNADHGGGGQQAQQQQQQVMNISFANDGGQSTSGMAPGMAPGMMPGGAAGARQTASPPGAINYPPLTGSKHFCSICGDRASGSTTACTLARAARASSSGPSGRS